MSTAADARRRNRQVVDARAAVAMRDEDLRITRKHEHEAAARIGTPDNHQAYLAACRWTDACAEARRLAGCHLRDVLA